MVTRKTAKPKTTKASSTTRVQAPSANYGSKNSNWKRYSPYSTKLRSYDAHPLPLMQSYIPGPDQ